jgi:hypothetical protein
MFGAIAATVLPTRVAASMSAGTGRYNSGDFMTYMYSWGG